MAPCHRPPWSSRSWFYGENMQFVAALVFCSTVLFPLTELLALLYVLISISTGYTPPGFNRVLRLIQFVRAWEMIEVFMLVKSDIDFGDGVSQVASQHLTNAANGAAECQSGRSTAGQISVCPGVAAARARCGDGGRRRTMRRLWLRPTWTLQWAPEPMWP